MVGNTCGSLSCGRISVYICAASWLLASRQASAHAEILCILHGPPDPFAHSLREVPTDLMSLAIQLVSEKISLGNLRRGKGKGERRTCESTQRTPDSAQLSTMSTCLVLSSQWLPGRAWISGRASHLLCGSLAYLNNRSGVKGCSVNLWFKKGRSIAMSTQGRRVADCYLAARLGLLLRKGVKPIHVGAR